MRKTGSHRFEARFLADVRPVLQYAAHLFLMLERCAAWILQMHDAIFNFLGTPLIPELRADVPAGAACNVQF